MQDRYENFTINIARISRAIRKIKSEEMQSFNLKTPHVSCLYYLYKAKETITAKELCDMCDEDKAAISRSLEFLEENGYIKTSSKTNKKYKSPLILTEKGKDMAEYINNTINNILGIASDGLTEQDRVIFYKSLILISDNLEKICNNYGEK